MKVKELREVFEDAWFCIVKVNEKVEDDIAIFDQSKWKTTIPEEIGEMEVSWVCVDTPTEDDDTVIFVAV
jgi:hypothetical protein